MAATAQPVKQEIIASLFSRRSPEDGNLEETYISHVKVWENEEGGGRKPRYLMIAASRTGRCIIHKCKRNSNNTFSKGKTWNVEDIRALEVFDSFHFSLTMSKPYHWETEREREQQAFVEAVAKVYNKYMRRPIPRIVGLEFRDDRSEASSSSGAPPRPSHDSQAGASLTPAVSTDGSSYQTSASPAPSHARPRPIPSPARSSEALSQQEILRSNLSTSARDADAPPPRWRRKGSEGSDMLDSMSMGGGGRRPSRDEDSNRDSRASNASASSSPSPTFMRAPSSQGQAGLSRSPNANPSPLNPLASSPQPASSLTQKAQLSFSPRAKPPAVSITIHPASNVSLESQVSTSPSMQVSSSKDEARAVSPAATSPISGRFPSPSSPTSRVPSPQLPTLGAPSKLSSSLATPTPAPSTLAPPGTNGNGLSLSSSALAPPGATSSRTQRKMSLLPPPLQTSFSRDLLLADDALTPVGGNLGDDDGAEDVILANVEEMLEGWDPGSIAEEHGPSGKGTLESQLLDELSALEAANIHSFLEADERIALVLEHIDRTILQLDETDARITSYKIQLNTVSDDISFIESQNRGLQVQTSNQKALLEEIQNLLQIVHVDKENLMILTQESLREDRGIQSLEMAAASLYKALQAGRDTAVGDMAAAIERISEYQTHNAQFCKRISDFLFIMVKFQSETIPSEKEGKGASMPTIKPHTTMEDNLRKYSGLTLYIKEMDESWYQKLCAAYFSAASELHKKEMKETLLAYIAKVKKTVEEESAESFVTGGGAPPGQASKVPGALARSKTMAALRSDGGRKDKKGEAELKASEAFERAFAPIVDMVYREESFFTEFLHINRDSITFADYMGLESYFRRQAARFAANGPSQSVLKLTRNAMDLTFGFLVGETKGWIDGALQRDPMQIVGIMAVCERFLIDAEQRNGVFLVSLFQRQLQKLTGVLDQYINSQVRAIEGTKLTIKKRKGVAPFVKHFPVFIDRFEGQLLGTDGLVIRETVDAAYEKIANSMFESLQQMAKMDGAEGLAAEDKGQLNYHVILIENMHLFIEEMSQQNPATFEMLLARARGIYRENMDSYIRLVLRKTFSRLMDFFQGIERYVSTSPSSDVASLPQYSRSTLKRVVKEVDTKDMRKGIDTLYKRIQKHFDQSSTADGPSPQSSAELVEVVASEVQGELAGMVERYSALIARCYPDSGVAFDFGVNDVATGFKRAKTNA